jgi:transposase
VPASGHTTGVFTALAARRSWSLAEKRAILDEMAVPGAIVMEVARRHGIAQSLLYRWRTDAAAAAAKLKPPRVFVPVAIEAPLALPPGHSSSMPALATIIEIDLVGGRTVRVTADIDAAALTRIVATLESLPGARA